MTVDKHELLFRILNRELFSLWANCVHDLAVKIQALGKLFILDYFRILNRELFSLWANCVHDLAVKIQTLGKLFILDYFAGTWTCIFMFSLRLEL